MKITEIVLTSNQGRLAKISLKHLGRAGIVVGTGPSTLRVHKREHVRKVER